MRNPIKRRPMDENSFTPRELDVMINRMQGTSNYLSQQLSMLGNMNSNK